MVDWCERATADGGEAADAATEPGRCGATMFVCKGDGFTARYTIRFRPKGA